jgi:hypothetical protein
MFGIDVALQLKLRNPGHSGYACQGQLLQQELLMSLDSSLVSL